MAHQAKHCLFIDLQGDCDCRISGPSMCYSGTRNYRSASSTPNSKNATSSLKHTLTVPEMTPLIRPGIPLISEKLLEVKYSSQVALSSLLPLQKNSHRAVGSSIAAGLWVGGAWVGPTVLFSNERKEAHQGKVNKSSTS